MKRTLFSVLSAAALALLPTAPARAQQPEKKFDDFDQVVHGAKEYEGLFHLYLKDDHLYAEIQPQQFNQPFLCPIAVAHGLGIGGDTLNFGEQWVLLFRRVGDKVHLVRRNVHFQAKRAAEVGARAVETTYTDSVLMKLPRIQSIHPTRGSRVLINLNDIFMTDFAQLGAGPFDASRSVWNKVKAFPRNIELEVAATYSGGPHDGSVIDSRGYHGRDSLRPLLYCQFDDGYMPRLADDRVGHFLTVVKDFSSDSKDTSFEKPLRQPLAAGAGRTGGPEEPQQAVGPEKEDRFLDRKVRAG